MVKDHARSAADKSKAIDKESDLTQEAQDELKARRLQESKRRKTLADLKHHLKTLQDELTGVVESENVQVSGYFFFFFIFFFIQIIIRVAPVLSDKV